MPGMCCTDMSRHLRAHHRLLSCTMDRRVCVGFQLQQPSALPLLEELGVSGAATPPFHHRAGACRRSCAVTHALGWILETRQSAQYSVLATVHISPHPYGVLISESLDWIWRIKDCCTLGGRMGESREPHTLAAFAVEIHQKISRYVCITPRYDVSLCIRRGPPWFEPSNQCTHGILGWRYWRNWTTPSILDWWY